jgi:integral membrane protein
MLSVLKIFERSRPFTDAEAWMLFRIAAYGEAIGWTLLITGIALEHMTGSHAYVAIGGRIHGMLFVSYLAACVVLYPSLGWSRWRALFALAFSTPPYGTLLFEQWVAYKRRAHGFKKYQHYLLYSLLLENGWRMANLERAFARTE